MSEEFHVWTCAGCFIMYFQTFLTHFSSLNMTHVFRFASPIICLPVQIFRKFFAVPMALVWVVVLSTDTLEPLYKMVHYKTVLHSYR